MHPEVNNLKKTVFFEMLNLAGRVFILTRYSDNVLIGNRGLTEEEKEKGIVLVFNKSMDFIWDDAGISASLVFGSSPQKCFIPAEDIMMIYSPELNSQFVAVSKPSDEAPMKEDKGDLTAGEVEKVVRIDFTKRKK